MNLETELVKEGNVIPSPLVGVTLCPLVRTASFQEVGDPVNSWRLSLCIIEKQ